MSATTNLARHHAVDLQVPIGELASEIAKPGAEQERLEAFVLTEIDNGAPLQGTYPPDATTLARYREDG